MRGGVINRMTAIGVAISMFASPALASASAVATPTQTISPMVALSIFGSQASAAALCGSSSTVAASTAASAQAPAGGCVLPVVDAPPPAPMAEPLPAAAPVTAVSGFGITPVLLGLAGIAALAALIASSNKGNNNNAPVSVN